MKKKWSHRNTFKLREDLLDSREMMFNKILFYMNKDKLDDLNTFIIAGLNIKGFPKYAKHFDRSLNYLLIIIETIFSSSKIKSYRVFKSIIGSFLIIEINESPIIVKNVCYNIEKNWRFFDLDIFFENKIISSNLLNFPEKLCVICQEKVSVCNRKKRHSIRQIRKKIIYLINEFCRRYEY